MTEVILKINKVKSGKCHLKKKKKITCYYSYVGRHCRRREFKLKLQTQYQICTRIPSSYRSSWAKDFGFEPSLHKERKITVIFGLECFIAKFCSSISYIPFTTVSCEQAGWKEQKCLSTHALGWEQQFLRKGYFGSYGSLSFEWSCFKAVYEAISITH